MKKNIDNYSYFIAINQLREEAIQFHTERYIEVGFFRKDDVDPYQADSTYFVATSNEDQKVVGVSRLISKRMAELPTMKEFKIYDIEKAKLKKIENQKYAEMSALTKLPRHDCTLGILRTSLQYSLKINTNYWFCSLDERVHKYMCRMFKFPFKQIGEPQVYLGSKTIPCILDLIETRQVLKESKFRLYEYLYTPTELEAVK